MTSVGVCPFHVCDAITPGNHLLPTEHPAAILPGFKWELLSLFSPAKFQGSTLMVLTRPWTPPWAPPHAQGIMMPGSYFHLLNQVKLPPPEPHGLISQVKVKVSVAQWCLTLCNTMDCSLPDSSVHGILQVRILEWVAMPSSRGSSQCRD